MSAGFSVGLAAVFEEELLLVAVVDFLGADPQDDFERDGVAERDGVLRLLLPQEERLPLER